MDPNETLRRIRAIVAELRELDGNDNHGDPDPYRATLAGMAELAEQRAELAGELAELAAALDLWIRRGGFLPDAWEAARVDPGDAPAPRPLTLAQFYRVRDAIELDPVDLGVAGRWTRHDGSPRRWSWEPVDGAPVCLDYPALVAAVDARYRASAEAAVDAAELDVDPLPGIPPGPEREALLSGAVVPVRRGVDQ